MEFQREPGPFRVISQNCLVCSGKVEVAGGTQSLSKIDKQVQVIFILNKVLELPSSELAGFLQQWGNPEFWIQLCENCNEDIEHIKKIYWKLNDISKKWDEGKRTLREKIRTSNTKNGKESQLSHISKECLKFICQQPIKVEIHVRADSPELDDDNDYETGISNLGSGKEDGGSYSEIEDDDSDDWIPGYCEKKAKEMKKKKKKEEEKKNKVVEFKCGICSEIFTNHESLEAHVAVDHFKSNERTCDQCGETFGGQVKLNKHLLKVHGVKTLRCTVPGCSEVFDRQYKLEVHVAKCTGQEPGFKCSMCKGAYYTSKLLEKHVRYYHERVGAVQCSKCGKSLHCKSVLAQHMEHCGHFTCELCGKTFNSEKRFKYHQRVTHEPKPERPPPPSMQRVNCNICGESFSCRSHLKRHVLMIHENFAICCDLCGVTLKGNGPLKLHMASKHNIGDIKCTVEGCDRMLATPAQLEEHVKYFHEKQQRPLRKELFCEFCGFSTRRRSTLLQHLAKNHQGQAS